MSHPSAAVVEQVTSVDWKVVAAALAVFIGTFVTTVYGWVTKKKETQKSHIKSESFDIPIAGGVIQDNQTLRESVIVYREVRDALLIHHHSVQSQIRSLEDNTRSIDDVAKRLEAIQRMLEKQKY